MGLLSWGVSFSDLNRRAAIYVDKILKGATPPTPSRTTYQVRAGRQSQNSQADRANHCANVLARADRIIK
jgi:hypothetical protein